MEDWQLLCEFVTRDSQRAFQELVGRHVGLVHSVALRLVRDSQLTEEVTQAVFILLARKARGLKQKTVLAGWLYRTTRFVASRALRFEQRRQRREQEAFQMQQTASSDDTWRRLAPVLDDAIERLGTADRDAILLRYFEEQPLHKVGSALGISEEAARKRVDRSLEKLRTFFARRGFSITTTLLAGSLAGHSAHAAPAGLAGNVASAAFAHAGVTTASLPALVKETLSAWRWATTRMFVGWGVGGTVGVLLLLNGAAAMRQRAASAPAPAATVADRRAGGSHGTEHRQFARRRGDTISGRRRLL